MKKEIDLLYKRANLDKNYVVSILNSISFQPNFCVDVGCGPGITTSLIQERFLNSIVCGIDNDSDILNVALINNKSKNTYFVLADAKNMPLESNSVDLCFCKMLLDIIDDVDALIDEMIRIIKNNGIIILYGNTRTTGLGDNMHPQNALKIIDAYYRYKRITNRRGFDVNYIVDRLSKNGLLCEIKRIIKDTNNTPRKDLLCFYGIKSNDLERKINNNILVKLGILQYQEVYDYERSMFNMLNENNCYLSFEQAVIVARRKD